MDETTSSNALSDKLTAPVMALVIKRKNDLMPMLQNGPGAAACTVLRDDECVRKIATFCYPLMPGLLRLAVKEHVFVSFVLNNREKLLSPLLAPADATAT